MNLKKRLISWQDSSNICQRKREDNVLFIALVSKFHFTAFLFIGLSTLGTFIIF